MASFHAPAGKSETQATRTTNFFQVSFHQATMSTIQEPDKAMLLVSGMSTYVIAHLADHDLLLIH